MKQILLSIPKMLEAVLERAEKEQLNVSEDRAKHTKKLFAQLRGITSDMKEIAESHNENSNENLMKLLSDIQNIQGNMPEMDPEKLKELAGSNSGLSDLLKMGMGLANNSPGIIEAKKILSPIEQMQSLMEVKKLEKTSFSQSKASGTDTAKDKA